VRLGDQPFWKAFAYRWARIIVLSVREFGQDKCALRASALTFFSVLSIVPVAAMAFGVAKGFGMDQMLENSIRDRLPGQEEAVDMIIGFARNQLTQTKGGVVAGVGLVFLFWTVVRVLTNIERSFNDIWGVNKERSWLRRFVDYLAFVVIGPIIIVSSSSLTVYIAGTLQAWSDDSAVWGAVSLPLLLAARMLPALLVVALFTFMFAFMPHTRVNIRSALLGGIVAGAAYQVTQAVYVYFQIGVSQYGAIYGSFAALPLFLVWMQISWLIVLFGAELCYAHQNVQRYEFRPDTENMSPAFRRLLALAIVQYCVKAFERGETPPEAETIAESLGVPSNVVNTLLGRLVDVEVLAEAATGDERRQGYTPARNTQDLTIAFVTQRLDEHGSSDLPLSDSADLAGLRAHIAELRSTEESATANLPLRDV
jgi:membrane protein